MKKKLQILNGIALISTIVINYLSNTGVFNGKTMAMVSAKYQNLFTPAGYAFSIWGLIYTALLGFSIYYGRSLFKPHEDEDNTVLKIGWWFIISCTANCMWVVVWLYEYTFLSVLLMVLLLFSLLKIISSTNMALSNVPLKKLVFLWWPFSIYSGWISVALIANIAAYLTKLKWNAFGISETAWTILMFAIAAFIHIFMIWNRNMRAFALVAIWAAIAIALINQKGNNTVFLGAVVTSVVIFINIVAHAFYRRKAAFVSSGNP